MERVLGLTDCCGGVSGRFINILWKVISRDLMDFCSGVIEIWGYYGQGGRDRMSGGGWSLEEWVAVCLFNSGQSRVQ